MHDGDLDGLARQLADRPGSARARIVNANGASSTALHAACNWPGYVANGPAVVRMLLASGADVNAAITDSWHAETPLHGAASTDDVEVARALIDGGAYIEVLGGSISGGTPLDNADGYGCWRVARLLVERLA